MGVDDLATTAATHTPCVAEVAYTPMIWILGVAVFVVRVGVISVGVVRRVVAGIVIGVRSIKPTVTEIVESEIKRPWIVVGCVKRV